MIDAGPGPELMSASAAELRAAAERPSPGGVMQQRFREAGEERPDAAGPGVLARLATLMRRHRGQVLLSLVFMTAAIVAQLGLTVAARDLVDVGLRADGALLRRSFVVMAVAVGSLALFSALRLYAAHSLGERIVAELRRAVFARVLRLDAIRFLRVPPGEVLSRMSADMTIVEMVCGDAAHIALRSILILLGTMAMLLAIDPAFALMMLIVLGLAVAPLLLFARRVRRLSREAQDRFADAMIPVGESLGALETVQAFGRERAVAQRFAAATEIALAAGLRRIRAKATMNGLLILMTFGGLLLLMFEAASDAAMRQGVSEGILVQMLVLALMAGSAVRDLGNVWGDMQRAGGALERIDELIAMEPGIAAPAVPMALPEPARGEIAFEGVTFAYPGREATPALDDFSLTVRAGERVALVGPSGAGKSSVLRLVLRFYDPQVGRVTIDGVDLRDADPAEIRARIALVDQEASLLSGSVADNIGFGKQGASEAEIWSAARAAQAGGFVADLPQGLASAVGSRGRALSGGQRQRLAIARALLRDAPILLLDEATSALDTENERLIQQALEEAMGGPRTSLIIAHRLSTVLEADRIVVMDRGRVVEEGRHGELIAADGFYAHLAKLQFRA